MVMRLPPAERLGTLTAEELHQLLDVLFEPSPELHAVSSSLLDDQRVFGYDNLLEKLYLILNDLLESEDVNNTVRLDRILQAHPRLGEKKIESAQSQAEQAQLRSSDDESSEELSAMNARYEDTFDGLKYVVYVNGRPRTAICEDMRARIHRKDIHRERVEAIQAMCEIAADRVRKLGMGFQT